MKVVTVCKDLESHHLLKKGKGSKEMLEGILLKRADTIEASQFTRDGRFLGHFKPLDRKPEVWELDTAQHYSAYCYGQQYADENVRLAVVEGYEMVSKDEKNEAFVLEKDQC
ncbi:hypothetical protein AgCh_004732 [Apium graveolens]